MFLSMFAMIVYMGCKSFANRKTNDDDFERLQQENGEEIEFTVNEV